MPPAAASVRRRLPLWSLAAWSTVEEAAVVVNSSSRRSFSEAYVSREFPLASSSSAGGLLSPLRGLCASSGVCG